MLNSVCFFIFRRQLADIAFEGLGEEGHIGKAAKARALVDLTAIADQPCRLLAPILVDVFHHRLPCHLLEDACERVFVDENALRDAVEREMLIVVLADVGDGGGHGSVGAVLDLRCGN